MHHTEGLTLFVAGDTPRAHRARANLADALREAARGLEKVREVDVQREPERVVAHGPVVTPALVRETDDGERSILLGDLSDRSKLKRFLARWFEPSE